MQIKPLVSVIVCTYNRADLLEYALCSLVDQTTDKSLYEVIVINNNSTDNTDEVAVKFTQKYNNIRVVREDKQGLSYARNRGYKEAKAEWVAYIDDDARAFDNYIERMIYVVRNYDFDCFGGTYLPWFKYGKPKWIPKDFGTNRRKLEKVGILKKGFATGCVIVFKKDVLKYFNGFHTSLGMSGDSMGYGEETQLQVLMRKNGFVIGFDPELQIEHVVHSDKLTLFWFIKAPYFVGCNFWESFDISPNMILLIKMLSQSFIDLATNMLSASKKLLQPDYYIQNWFIDTLSPFTLNITRITKGFILLHKKKTLK